MLNEIQGKVKINGIEYFISSSKHSQEVRGNASQARDKIITFSLIKKLFKDIKIPEGNFVVTWKYKDFYDGILFNNKDNKIKIITSIIGQKKKSPDKLFPNINVRFNIGELSA